MMEGARPLNGWQEMIAPAWITAMQTIRFIQMIVCLLLQISILLVVGACARGVSHASAPVSAEKQADSQPAGLNQSSNSDEADRDVAAESRGDIGSGELVFILTQHLEISVRKPPPTSYRDLVVLALFDDGLFVTEVVDGPDFGTPKVGRLSPDAMQEFLEHVSDCLDTLGMGGGPRFHSSNTFVCIFPMAPDKEKQYIWNGRVLWYDLLTEREKNPEHIEALYSKVNSCVSQASLPYEDGMLEDYRLIPWLEELIARHPPENAATRNR